MENRINIAELLKDSPKGMELYSPMFGKIYLEGVKDTGHAILIEVSTSCNSIHQFYPDGKYNTYYSESECLLFPSKDQRDWSKFQRPFKDGDIVTWEDRGSLVAFIYKERKDVAVVKHHFALYTGSLGTVTDGEISLVENEIVFATEEEKEKLFDAIKANGYKWNEETKTLEKLPKFKVGDRIRKMGETSTYTITDVNNAHYFCGKYVICDTCDNDWELVHNKFDINTLKPFDKVLVRDSNEGVWSASIFSHTWENKYICIGVWYNQCIPYEGNEHLLGITNDCDDFYKTWE